MSVEQEQLTSDLIARCHAIISQEPGIRLAIVYGSAATGRLHSTSDIDIALLGNAPLDLDDRLSLMAKLSSATNREVDLVDLFDLGGLLLKQILCKGRLILNRDQAAYENLAQRMLYEAEDFLPLVRRAQKERLKRFIDGQGACSRKTREAAPLR